MHKGSNKNEFCFQERKMRYNAMGQASRQKYILRQIRKRLNQQARKVCTGENVAILIKEKAIKINSNAQTFHSCTIMHCMTHCIRYMFSYLKQECIMKQGLASDKSFKKTFGEKEGNSNKSKFSKGFKSTPWHQSCKSNPVDI